MNFRDSKTIKIFVYISGNRWDDVEGTDRRLAAALGEDIPVLWVDPPLAVHRAFDRGARALFRGIELQDVAPGITRLRWLFVPGATRGAVAPLTAAALYNVINRCLKVLGVAPAAVMCTSPVMTLPDRVSGTKILYVTDDWVSGADLMGLSLRLVKKNLVRNLQRADITLAVSPHLVNTLNREPGRQVEAGLLPNGCVLPAGTAQSSRGRTAALVGTLNERLDLALLEKLAESGTPLLVIGPRADKDPAFSARLDRFLAADTVRWLGKLPAASLPGYLATASVGLTPYVSSEFNRASFPLKTLDYLAAGLAVVATDLPAVRWLDSEDVAVAKDHTEFLNLVHLALRTPSDPATEARRRSFAGSHSWSARSSALLALVDARASKTASTRTAVSLAKE
ncbi:glycosyltransferase [Arthrobacter sp. PM3]|uniref:glycosyltransferase n=1 Tax=Arthrobacter sp. PM3 TaxID=2017685 RepID=UPI001ABF41CB|nr:glycosyltransferase [Arthrobacter sp. PM3]